jgi:hypothetical protein
MGFRTLHTTLPGLHSQSLHGTEVSPNYHKTQIQSFATMPDINDVIVPSSLSHSNGRKSIAAGARDSSIQELRRKRGR